LPFENILVNLLYHSVSELYEYALLPEHLTSVDPHITPTTIADSGALSVSSGLKTGRTPKEKRVVLDETTKDKIWWGSVNIPISHQGYDRNRKRAIDFFNIRPRVSDFLPFIPKIELILIVGLHRRPH
jgi:phosphoenolpyruvate carboxykinase (ATP)